MRQAVQVFRGGNPFNRLSYFSFAKNHSTCPLLPQSRDKLVRYGPLSGNRGHRAVSGCLYVDGQTISRPTGTDVAGSRLALSRSSGSEATPFNLRRAPFGAVLRGLGDRHPGALSANSGHHCVRFTARLRQPSGTLEVRLSLRRRCLIGPTGRRVLTAAPEMIQHEHTDRRRKVVCAVVDCCH